MAYENNDKKMESVYSKRIKAGKRRTYFFDVRETRGNDYYLTITESRKRFDSDGYDRHKIFLYKEDFNKFVKGLSEAVDFVKTDLMPDFDFDAFNHDTPYEGEDGQSNYGSASGTDAGTQDASSQNLQTPSQPAGGDTDTGSETSGSNDSTFEAPRNNSLDEDVDKW